MQRQYPAFLIITATAFLTLKPVAGILSTTGGIGIYEGSELDPVFYSQSAILFGSASYFGYKTFYLDRRLQEKKSESYTLLENDEKKA